MLAPQPVSILHSFDSSDMDRADTPVVRSQSSLQIERKTKKRIMRTTEYNYQSFIDNFRSGVYIFILGYRFDT